MKTPTRSFVKQSLSNLRAQQKHASKLNHLALDQPEFAEWYAATYPSVERYADKTVLKKAAKWRKLTGWPKVKKVAA